MAGVNTLDIGKLVFSNEGGSITVTVSLNKTDDDGGGGGGGGIVTDIGAAVIILISGGEGITVATVEETRER